MTLSASQLFCKSVGDYLQTKKGSNSGLIGDAVEAAREHMLLLCELSTSQATRYAGCEQRTTEAELMPMWKPVEKAVEEPRRMRKSPTCLRTSALTVAGVAEGGMLLNTLYNGIEKSARDAEEVDELVVAQELLALPDATTTLCARPPPRPPAPPRRTRRAGACARCVARPEQTLMGRRPRPRSQRRLVGRECRGRLALHLAGIGHHQKKEGEGQQRLQRPQAAANCETWAW
jgi:hypothetical protein